ncbi:MAG: nucleotidyltransferase family protein [Anaeromyxobacteraceae bacterium]
MSLGEAEQGFLLRAVLQLPAEPVGALDWTALADRARTLGVSGLAWRAAAPLGLSPAPPGYAALRRHAEDDAAQTALTVNAFARASRALAAAGVPCLALKGVALCVHDPGYGPLRHVSDLDLLVRGADAGKADAVLRADGARPLPRRPTLEGAHGLAAAAAEPVATGVGGYVDTTGVKLDLHVAPPAEVEGGTEGLLARAIHAEVQGVAVRVPALEDLAVIACEHALVHHVGDPAFLPRLAADLVRLGARGALAQPGRSPAVAEGLALVEEARSAAASRAPAPTRLGQAFEPAGWAPGFRKRAVGRLRLLSRKGWISLFPSRAYLAASYGVPDETWWLPLLHVRRLLVDQPLAVLGWRGRRGGHRG